MAAGKLKVNPEKTEFFIFGSPAQHASLSNVYRVENLGNLLLTLGFHSPNKSTDYQMPDFAHIRRFCQK